MSRCCCCRERVWGGGGGGCIAGTWEPLGEALLLLALGGWRGAKTAVVAAKRRTAPDPAVRNVRWSVGSNAVGSTSAHLRDGRRRRRRCQCGSDSGFPEWMGSGMTGAGMESEQQQQ